MNKDGYKLFNMPWPLFCVFACVVIVSVLTGTLPQGMAGCFAFMIVLGTVLNEIGDHTPIIKDYLGGGAVVVIFGSALLNYLKILPQVVETLEDGTIISTMGNICWLTIRVSYILCMHAKLLPLCLNL